MTVHKHSTIAEYARIYDLVNEWVYERLAHDITLDQFCEATRYKRRSVQRALQMHDTCWREILIGKRMEGAELKLRSTALSVSDIAFRVGYTNTSLFTRLFKETYGVSPKTYREENR